MSDMSGDEPATGRTDTLALNGDGDGLPSVNPVLQDAYDDDELDAAEFDEAAVLYDGRADDSSQVPDVDITRIEARQDAIEDYHRRREAARVHRKVHAATAGSVIAGSIPALLAAVDALKLPAEIEPFVLLAVTMIGAFFGGYVVPERSAPLRPA